MLQLFHKVFFQVGDGTQYKVVPIRQVFFNQDCLLQSFLSGDAGLTGSVYTKALSQVDQGLLIDF